MDSRKTNSPQTFPAPSLLPTDREDPVDERAELLQYIPTDPSADRHKMIADAAYYRARQRGFESGHELEDWLAAENEIVKSWLEQAPPSEDK